MQTLRSKYSQKVGFESHVEEGQSVRATEVSVTCILIAFDNFSFEAQHHNIKRWPSKMDLLDIHCICNDVCFCLFTWATRSRNS